jgi:hypothetical protein
MTEDANTQKWSDNDEKRQSKAKWETNTAPGATTWSCSARRNTRRDSGSSQESGNATLQKKVELFFINVESNTHSFLASLGLLQFEESGEKRKISSRTIQNGQKRPERTKMRTNLREENDKSTLLDVI